MSSPTKHIDQLQYITGNSNQLEQVKNACLHGIKWVQLRMKQVSETEFLETAKASKKICDEFNVQLIINDHVKICQQVNADGIHLGKNDMPVQEARRILGNNKIIGGTANNLEDIVFLTHQNVDYIGLGPFRFTSTKKNLSPILEASGTKAILEQVKKQKITTPIVSVGGILISDLIELQKTKIYGVAISSAISKDFDSIKDFQKQLDTWS